MNLTLYNQLKSQISGEVRWDNASRVLYSTDASNFQVVPQGVVLPRTEQDIITTLTLCAAQNIPVTMRGGGSSLAGQAIGPGVILDTSKYFNRVLEVDEANRTVRVEPGMVLGKLNQHLASIGLQFGPDPASAARATIGGIIGTNATGAHSIRYGMTSDNVIALRCVLANGEVVELKRGATGVAQQLGEKVAEIATRYEEAIRRDFPRVWRRASGYNLDYITEMLAYTPADPYAALTPAQQTRIGLNSEMHLHQISDFSLVPLIVGSDGTLAIVTEATLNLVPKPGHTALVVASFRYLVDAMDAIPDLLSVTPSAIELLGDKLMQLAAGNREFAGKISWANLTDEGVLVIEFEGETAEEAKEGVHRLLALADHHQLPCRLEVIEAPTIQADVWNVRKLGLAILMSIRSEYKPISVIEDVAVPVEHLADYVRALQAIFRYHNTDGAFYAHASAGVLHVRPLVNLKTEEGVATMESIATAALELCHRFGGAMSGEHGDGYERSAWNEALFGAEIYRAFCEIKDLFDPRGILNPGNKVRGRADTHSILRFGPDYYATPIPTVFQYVNDHSIAQLAEECNGSGVCRKPVGGVMCPSYRVTLEEQHSTRGRANLLRDMMTRRRGNGEDGTTQMEEVKQALDLCLSCKACSTECASQVDMSKMKSDFLQLYYDRKGTPLRARVLGNIALLSQLATAIPGMAAVANKMANLPVIKKALRLADRPLPAFAEETFGRWWASHPKATGNKGRVVLYADTFTRYNHPTIGKAAVLALESAGYGVIVPQWKCCGRPLVSQGQPRAARSLAQQNIDILAPYAHQGLPILGLEPSCISMFKQDYPDLIPGDDTTAVANAFFSIEQFLAEEGNASIVGVGKQILLHGHCHQKAVYGTRDTKRMLEQAGYTVKEMDSTCCGMAGAFGFEAEHYETAKQVGELSVLPAVRAAASDTLIVAPGTSCRQQIEELAGRQVWHPVELL